MDSAHMIRKLSHDYAKLNNTIQVIKPIFYVTFAEKQILNHNLKTIFKFHNTNIPILSTRIILLYHLSK